MSRRDTYHQAVKNALLKDGWTITHDPFHLKWGKKDLYVDLGAERLLAAQKGTLEIAVEVKSFLSPSEMADLEEAVGQYVLYHDIMAERDPNRILYLAVTQDVMNDVFDEAIGKLVLKNHRIRLLVFDPNNEVITQWIA